jgi:hypothetical protein
MLELTTERKVARTKAEFQKHAMEQLRVNELGSAMYAFGSELACLRLAYVYRYSGDKVKVGYSDLQESWYFRLEMSL